MDWTKFNPNDEGGNSHETAPPGNYIFFVTSFSRQRRNGKDQIVYLAAPVFDAKRNQIAGQYWDVRTTFTLTEKAAWAFANFLKAVSVNRPINVMSDSDLAEHTKGKFFRATTEVTSWEGKNYAKIVAYKRMDELDKRAAGQWLSNNTLSENWERDTYSEGDSSSESVDPFEDDEDDIPF